MDERLFGRLGEWLAHGPVVVATVLQTRGATPRKGGSRMLVTAASQSFSIGGGEAEARVIAAARRLLADNGDRAPVEIDLSGRPDAAGVCGGSMQLALRRWSGPTDRERAETIFRQLRAGNTVTLGETDIGHAGATSRTRPDERLLIAGGGHCGVALYEMARHLDFDIWIFDPRDACFADGDFRDAHVLSGDYVQLATALDTTRPVYAVLLNRDFPTDVATLEVLASKPPHSLA
ncbi:XdhC family protein [Tahibacter amnicola]|uniref:XdhC family protein n=1 Tax=Tahibacter amnicola TaxID=2976241 RepID=A0ABY6BFR7_9GAMM|nr:XdhC family protein [Tahibacter amnicola]UXI68670.1 XdhC family protein [Tahibacter amnicola]